jgi:hypothetical protein
MRIFKSSSVLTVHEKQIIYEVPFSGLYDAKYMRYLLINRLIPKGELSELDKYIKEVLVDEWDKALTIRVCVIIRYNAVIGGSHA